MNSSEQRIEAMQRNGTITAEQAAALLQSVRPPRRSLLRLLMDPFEKVAGGAAAGAGVVVALFMLAGALLGIRYDGFLDTHVIREPVPWATVAAEVVIGWMGGALVFWLLALVFAKHARLIDFIGAVGLARAPSLLTGALAVLLVPSDAAAMFSPVRLALVLPPLLVTVAWQIVLLVFGVRNATGLRGGKLAVLVVLGIFAAELASKLALHVLT